MKNYNSNKTFSLFFIRHGESEMNKNHSDLIGGRSPETKLSNNGKSQSVKLGRYFKLKGFKLDMIYSSTLIRSLDTAKIFANEYGNIDEIIESEELIELSQGLWEGMMRSEIYSVENLSMINSQGNFFIPPGGESKDMVIQRVSAWLTNNVLLRDFNEHKNIAVFSHGILIKSFLQHILNFNDSLTYKVDIDNTSVSKITFDSKGWHVNYINSTNHLEIIE